MVQNINKLKGKITENGYTIKTLATELGICETSLRRKINDKSEFSISESLIVKDRLNLSNNDIFQILLPCKTVFDLSQFFSITFIVVQIVLCVVFIPLFIFLFVYVINNATVDSGENTKVVPSVTVEDRKTYYKKISKYTIIYLVF